MNPYYKEPYVQYGYQFYEYAKSFREIGLIIDNDPTLISEYTTLPAIEFMLSDRESTAIERTKYLEALSYGDPGVVLACPGPSLSGLMLRELGLPNQIDDFYNYIYKHRAQTFFALTEPEKGSDANNIASLLSRCPNSRNNYHLTGTKIFFGNGAVGKMGIVLARANRGPLGIRAVWLTPELLASSNVSRDTLPMFALKGAQIARIDFDNLEIPSDQVLGHHLSACENGLLGIIKVFNRLRTGVGALAIGQAQSVYDFTYFKHAKSNISIFRDMYKQLSAARMMLHDSAFLVDMDSLNGVDVSVAKTYATSTAEEVIKQCFLLLDVAELFENPWLTKAYRDVFCWEYMEGTTHIQYKHIKQNLPVFMNDISKSRQ